MEKRGQAWGFDVMIAAAVFISGMIAFYFFALNYGSGNDQRAEELTYVAEHIANDLLSEGLPSTWNNDTVTRIGLLTNNKINQTKLTAFYDMAQADYTKTQNLFNTRLNYFINVSSPFTINAQSVQSIGQAPTQASNVERITRFTIYQETPITMYIIVWE